MTAPSRSADRRFPRGVGSAGAVPWRCHIQGVQLPGHHRPEFEPSVSEVQHCPGVSEAELRAYIRRNLVLTGIVLVSLLAPVGGLGAWYADELRGFARAVFDALGLPGLALLVFAADAVTSPISRAELTRG